MNVSLWIAVTETADVLPKLQSGKSAGVEIRRTEYRFLAKDFSEAAEIAKKGAINDDEIVEVQRVSHITGGVGKYRAVEIKETTPLTTQPSSV